MSDDIRPQQVRLHLQTALVRRFPRSGDAVTAYFAPLVVAALSRISDRYHYSNAVWLTDLSDYWLRRLYRQRPEVSGLFVYLYLRLRCMASVWQSYRWWNDAANYPGWILKIARAACRHSPDPEARFLAADAAFELWRATR
jgi:hypothetical protein